MTFTCAKEAPGNATAARTTKPAVTRPRFRRSKSAFSLTLHLLNKPQRTPGLAAIVSIIALHQQRLKVDYRLGHPTMTAAGAKVPAGARPLRWLQRATDPHGRDPLNALHIEEETMHKGPLVSRFAISTVL